jgi:hypothetical protein
MASRTVHPILNMNYPGYAQVPNGYTMATPSMSMPVQMPTAVPVHVIVVPAAAVCMPVAPVAPVAQPSPYQSHPQAPDMGAVPTDDAMPRKRKPDPSNELSQAFGSLASSKIRKHGSAAGKHQQAKRANNNHSTLNSGRIDKNKVTHMNETIRQELETKGYQIIADHAASRIADLEAENKAKLEGAAASAPSSPTGSGPGAIVSDEEAMKYFPNIISAFNRGSNGDLKTAVESVMAPNCVFRTHVVCVPGQKQTSFVDKIIPRDGIFDLFKSILESFPDACWKVESNRILTSKDGNVKTVAGYFTFRGTVAVLPMLVFYV